MAKRNVSILIGSILICAFLVTGVYIAVNRFIPRVSSPISNQNVKAVFPEINTANLSVNQNKVVEILRTEYATQPSGTKYSEGSDEPWCASFVSWVFNEAGVPLANPNSGYWRIPGTFTLREYYESIGKLRLADSGYSPKVGDIMLYDNPSPFGQHTNIVIKNDNGLVTTVGGNEPGNISIVEHIDKDDAGFIGYGIF